MSTEVKFVSNAIEVIGKVSDAVNIWLEEASGELEAQAKRNTSVGKVAGGNTKQNWKHKVDDEKHEAVVGNMLETAIWLELGTGNYAINGDGRKGGWYIPIGEGKGQISQKVVDAYGFKVVHGNDIDFAYTTGMKPQRPLHNAVETQKPKLQRRLIQVLKEIGDEE